MSTLHIRVLDPVGRVITVVPRDRFDKILEQLLRHHQILRLELASKPPNALVPYRVPFCSPPSYCTAMWVGSKKNGVGDLCTINVDVPVRVSSTQDRHVLVQVTCPLSAPAFKRELLKELHKQVTLDEGRLSVFHHWFDEVVRDSFEENIQDLLEDPE